MNTRFTLAAGALLLAAAAAAAPASAQNAYPHLLGGSDDNTVVYEPGYRGNVVGGGAVAISNEDGGKPVAVYGDDSHVQRRADGRVPVYVGTEENREVVWVQPSAAPSMRASGATTPRG